jgi:hypothetical protein
MKDRKHFQRAVETLLMIEGLMTLVSFVGEETEIDRIGQGQFLESIGAVGQIGVKLSVEALEHINRAERDCALLEEEAVQ